jgi:hypothetical protein
MLLIWVTFWKELVKTLTRHVIGSFGFMVPACHTGPDSAKMPSMAKFLSCVYYTAFRAGQLPLFGF